MHIRWINHLMYNEVKLVTKSTQTSSLSQNFFPLWFLWYLTKSVLHLACSLSFNFYIFSWPMMGQNVPMKSCHIHIVLLKFFSSVNSGVFFLGKCFPMVIFIYLFSFIFLWTMSSLMNWDDPDNKSIFPLKTLLVSASTEFVLVNTFHIYN